MTYGHQWSGWPGAYCQKCGENDYMELAIGDSLYDPYTNKWTTPEDEEKYSQQACRWAEWDFHSDEWKEKVRAFNEAKAGDAK